MTIENLNETFENCADWQSAPPPKPLIENGRDILQKEVHEQLWCAMMNLLANEYGLLPKIRLSATQDVEKEFTFLRFCWDDSKLTMSDHKEFMAAIEPFIDDVESVAGGMDIFFLASEGPVLCTIKYTKESLYDALDYLTKDFFPHNVRAISHLKNIRHLEERLCLDMPANRLN